MNDFDDFGTEFAPTPETGDLKTISDLVKRAEEIKEGLRKLDARRELGEALLKDILEEQLPSLMERSGLEECKAAGLHVKIEVKDFASVPAPSSIEKERDPERRDYLVDRRERALALLEAKAPSLIKRSYQLSFGRDEADEAALFEKEIASWADPPDLIKGLTVDPRTLSKWVKERKSEGDAFNDEEKEILGVYTKRVAKISR